MTDVNNPFIVKIPKERNSTIMSKKLMFNECFLIILGNEITDNPCKSSLPKTLNLLLGENDDSPFQGFIYLSLFRKAIKFVGLNCSSISSYARIGHKYPDGVILNNFIFTSEKKYQKS